jgi:hypothetical protein
MTGKTDLPRTVSLEWDTIPYCKDMCLPFDTVLWDFTNLVKSLDQSAIFNQTTLSSEDLDIIQIIFRGRFSFSLYSAILHWEHPILRLDTAKLLTTAGEIRLDNFKMMLSLYRPQNDKSELIFPIGKYLETGILNYDRSIGMVFVGPPYGGNLLSHLTTLSETT